MLLRLEAIRCWSGPDLIVTINEGRGAVRLRPSSLQRTVRVVERLRGFILTS